MKLAQTSSALLISALMIAQAFAGKPQITGRTDKDIYKTGEPVSFSFTVSDIAGETYVKWTRDGDDGKKDESIVKASTNGPVVVKTALDKPGFVRVLAKLVDQNGKNLNGEDTHYFASAGVDIDQLQGIAEPADFDAFWAAQKAKLAKVAMEPVARKEFESANPKVKMYKVSIPCAGPRPTTGYLVIPVGTGEQQLQLLTRRHGRIERLPDLAVRFVPMIELPGSPITRLDPP